MKSEAQGWSALRLTGASRIVPRNRTCSESLRLETSAAWLKKAMQAEQNKADAGVTARTAELPGITTEDSKIAISRMRVAAEQVNKESQTNVQTLKSTAVMAFTDAIMAPANLIAAIPSIPSRLSALGNWLWNDGLDHATNFVTGIADTITSGGTKKYRQYFGMDYVDTNSWMYAGGQLTGTAIAIGLGGAAGGVCGTGGRLIMIANAYTRTSTAVGMAQVAYKWYNNEQVGILDALAFAPAAGWAVGKIGKAVGAWGCFVGETQVVVGWDNTPFIATPESSIGEEWSWEWTALGAGAGITALIVRKRRQRDEDDDILPLDGYFARGYLEDCNRGMFDGSAYPIAPSRPRIEGSSVNCERASDSADPRPLRADKQSLTRGSGRHRTTGDRSGSAPKTSTRSLSKWVVPFLLFLSLCCFWQAAPRTERPGVQQAHAGMVSSDAANQLSSAPTRKLVTTPIKDLRTGQRVLVAAPHLDGTDKPQIRIGDPTAWRVVRLTMSKPDRSRLDIVLLRPLDWIVAAAFDAISQEATATTLPRPVVADIEDVSIYERVLSRTIRLNLPEMGISGPAEITSLQTCPQLEEGPGRLVTGTFAHSTRNVIELQISGISESIVCTGNHPFWSEDRQDFVPADDLHEGEMLRTLDGGSARLITTRRSGELKRVFNLEVEGVHVFHVSSKGVLVHNNCVINNVLNESADAVGDITSQFTLAADDALSAAMTWLGKGYREIGRPGQGVYRSADGLRQFRMDVNSLLGRHNPNVPHVHFEWFDNALDRFASGNNHVPIQ